MNVTKDKLAERLPLHRQWAMGIGGEKFVGVKADLRNADLRGAYLNGANLFEADLRNADLSGAYLSNANLVGAKLTDAKLTDAYLDGAYLREADLIEADLSGACLNGANLSGADLCGAKMIEADLSDAYLCGAYLRDADLSGAYLSGANLSGVIALASANLSNAQLPPWSKSEITWTTDGTVTINCYSKSIEDWDAWFAGSDVYETPRDTAEFARIEAAYQHAKRMYEIWQEEQKQ